MTGICGLYRPSRPVEADTTWEMVEAISHRGPDGDGVWEDTHVGLGHQLLHTTPESRHETLPEERDGLVITADARIDNRDRLREQLPLSGTSSPVTDAQLILAAYRQWGVDCPAHLLGAFSFAIWDSETRELFAARDHMGIKPFYYHETDGLFAFGSELKTLLAIEDVPVRLNETRIGDYLTGTLADESITFYEGINRLPRAHRMLVTPGGTETERYWSLDPERELIGVSEATIEQAFRELLAESVDCRLRSAGPVGSTLSGGMDSSSIVCLADRLRSSTDGPLHTFSVTFDTVPESDEREYIETVLEATDTHPQYIAGDEVSPLVDPERLYYHQDEPFYAPNLFMNWEMYKAAADAGVRVILDGYDGDTTISHGLKRFRDLARRGRWLTLSRELGAYAETFDRTRTDVFRQYVAAASVPDAVGRLRNALDRGRSGETIVADSFADRIGLQDRVERLQSSTTHQTSLVRNHHLRRLRAGTIPLALEAMDKAAAAFDVEPRYPFFDPRLVEFCLALPARYKLRNGYSRHVLRSALDDVLPRQLVERHDKSDLGPNFAHTLYQFENDRLASMIATPGPLSRYVDTEALQRTYHDYTARQNQDAALELWKSLTLSEWLKRAPFKPAKRL